MLCRLSVCVPMWDVDHWIKIIAGNFFSAPAHLTREERRYLDTAWWLFEHNIPCWCLRGCCKTLTFPLFALHLILLQLEFSTNLNYNTFPLNSYQKIQNSARECQNRICRFLSKYSPVGIFSHAMYRSSRYSVACSLAIHHSCIVGTRWIRGCGLEWDWNNATKPTQYAEPTTKVD
jgi:hypothetical protein